jgi:NAD(P)H dehydrogenase (quinone)
VTVLEVLCHPRPGSLNHAIADRAQRDLERRGHLVRFHDLYAERFDPVLSEEELARKFSLDDQVQLHTRELVEAGGLLLIHPDWWGQPPAMLKGWIDRVFRPGIAYEFEGGEFERKTRAPLLKGKRAVVICTSDAFEGEGLWRLEALWNDGVLRYCGMEPSFLAIPEVSRSSPGARLEWMRKIDQLLAAAFPQAPILAPA